MKKIVVLSDTHGNFSAIDKLIPIINESDFVFHLGDYDRDINAYGKEIKTKVYSVKGNCDGGGDDEILEIDGVKILLTHGDRYSVKSTLYKLFLRAKEVGATAVFFGHTHQPEITEMEGVQMINPGCMTRFSQNTYCYAVIHQGKLIAKIVEM